MRNFRKAIATLSVVAILSSLVVSTAFAGTFGDVPADAYYFNAVEELAYQGIVDSTNANFNPAKQLERQEAAKLVVESAGLMADVPAVGHFSDVPKTLWSYNSIETAFANGVVNGYSTAQGDLTGQFGPKDTVTRAQFAKMVVEAFDLPLYTPATPTFPDVRDTNAWYYQYVETAAYHGIVRGFDDGSFGANKQIVRQDGAVMIYRALGMDVVVDPTDPTDPTDPDYVPGDIEISLGDTPASAVVPVNATRVPFLTMDVDGAGTLKSLTFERFGAGSPSDFNNVYLYEGDKRLTTGRAINSSTHRVTFTGVNYVVDGMSELTVMADMGGLAASSGSVDGFRLYEVTSDDNVSFNNVEGELMSISSATVGTITIEAGANPSNPKLGETDVKIAEFRLTSDNTEAIDVYGVTLYQAENISRTNLSDFVLKQAGVEVASATEVESNDTIVLTFSSPYKLAKGENRLFELYASIGQGARVGDKVQLYLENKADLHTVGSVYGYGVQVTNTFYDGSAANKRSDVTVEGGQITISFQGPSIQNYAVNSREVELMRFNIIAQNEVEFRRTNLTVAYSGTSNDHITNIKLVDVDSGDLLVGPVDLGALIASGGILSDVWYMSAGESRTLAVKADVGSLATPDSTLRATLNQFILGDVRNLDNNTNVLIADIVPSSNVAGNSHKILSGQTSVSVSGVPAKQEYITGSNNLDMMGVVLSAGSGKDAYLKSITLEADGTGGCATETNCVLTVSLWDGSTQVGSTRSLAGDTVTFSNLNLKVTKGTSKTLLVKASLNSIATFPATLGFNIVDRSKVTLQDIDGNIVSAEGFVRASGTYTVTNAGVTGDTATVDGTALKEGVNWLKGATDATAATALASAINALPNVRASSVGAVVTVLSEVGGPAGNAITLATDDVVNLAISGATLAGGVSLTGPKHDVLSAGKITVVKAPNVVGQTDSRIVVASTAGETLAQFRFTAQNEALKLTKVPVSIGAATKEVTSLYLYDGATLVAGPVSPNGAGLAVFSSFTQDFVVPKNGNKILTVKADLSSTTNGKSGAEIVAELMSHTVDFQVTSAGGSNTTIYGDGSHVSPAVAPVTVVAVPGNPMRYRATNLSISRHNLTGVNLGGLTDVYKFSIDVTKEEVGIKQLGFRVKSNIGDLLGTAVIDGFELYLNGTQVADAKVANVYSNYFVKDNVAAADALDINPGDDKSVYFVFDAAKITGSELLISGSNEFVLKANVNGTVIKDETIVVSMLNDTALTAGELELRDSGTLPALSVGLFTIPGGVEELTSNFVWSDLSSIPHDATQSLAGGTSSVDWANSFLLKNFPLSSQTVQRL